MKYGKYNSEENQECGRRGSVLTGALLCAWQVFVPGYLRKRLTVLAVSDLFELITLMFPRPTLAQVSAWWTQSGWWFVLHGWRFCKAPLHVICQSSILFRRCIKVESHKVLAGLHTQPIARRPQQIDNLAVVRTFFICKEGGACQVGQRS